MKNELRAGIVALMAALAAIGASVWVAGAHEPSRPAASAPRQQQPAPRDEPEQSSPPAGPPAPARMHSRTAAAPLAAPSENEESLMQSLRDASATDPAGTIARARDVEAHFPDSPHAPERAWLVVRSLVSQSRFHEARDAAQVMVARFPNNSWALDAQRHLLVYPLDQPSREETAARQ